MSTNEIVGDDDKLVVVSVIEFHHHSDNNLNYQLKEKMRNYRKQIPFSMKFEEIAQIAPPQYDPFQHPSDTKISYNHNCICVADESNMRIVFFNLETREFISSFKPSCDEYLTYLFIEENFDGQSNDAIYFGECDPLDSRYSGEYGGTYKYGIKELLMNDQNHVDDGIWKTYKMYENGIAMRNTTKYQKQLLRFNTQDQMMDMIDPTNGEIIGNFQLENVSRISNTIFITPNRMIVSEIDMNKCFIFEEVLENEWKLIKEIEQADNIMISRPFGMAIDRVGQRIFISDNKRLIVIDYDGNILQTHKSSSTENELNPFGLCFDDRTGLLYVTDQQSVRVFK